MDPESIEAAKNPEGEMINFIRSMHKEEREEQKLQHEQEKKISWRKKTE